MNLTVRVAMTIREMVGLRARQHQGDGEAAFIDYAVQIPEVPEPPRVLRHTSELQRTDYYCSNGRFMTMVCPADENRLQFEQQTVEIFTVSRENADEIARQRLSLLFGSVVVANGLFYKATHEPLVTPNPRSYGVHFMGSSQHPPPTGVSLNHLHEFPWRYREAVERLRSRLIVYDPSAFRYDHEADPSVAAGLLRAKLQRERFDGDYFRRALQGSEQELRRQVEAYVEAHERDANEAIPPTRRLPQEQPHHFPSTTIERVRASNPNIPVSHVVRAPSVGSAHSEQKVEAEAVGEQEAFAL